MSTDHELLDRAEAHKDYLSICTNGISEALGTLTLPLRDPDLPDVLEVPGEVLFYVAQALLAVAVALTLWSGWEFFRDLWKQRHTLRGPRSATVL